MKRLIHGAMVALAVVATYYVYEFTQLVAPQWVAIAAAGSLVLTYVGLAYADLPPERQHQAQYVAVAAMAIEAAYGFLFVLHQQSPQLFQPPLALTLSIILALLHGAPFTVLLYFVALLVVHRPEAQEAQQDTHAALIELVAVLRQQQPALPPPQVSYPRPEIASTSSFTDAPYGSCAICGTAWRSPGHKGSVARHGCKHCGAGPDTALGRVTS